jgi:hypothetical protein
MDSHCPPFLDRRRRPSQPKERRTGAVRHVDTSAEGWHNELRESDTENLRRLVSKRARTSSVDHCLDLIPRPVRFD